MDDQEHSVLRQTEGGNPERNCHYVSTIQEILQQQQNNTINNNNNNKTNKYYNAQMLSDYIHYIALAFIKLFILNK